MLVNTDIQNCKVRNDLHSYNLSRQRKIIVWRVASLTERFVENDPLWKQCLWKVEYIRLDDMGRTPDSTA